MSFLRANTVNILKYLPEFLASDPNFKAVADTCSNEHEKQRLLLQDIFNQFFVEKATWGLAGYERVLGLVPKAADDYTARRNRILARYQANQTTTLAFLANLAKRYMSAEAMVTVEENNPEYSFRIVTTGGSILYASDMVEAINLYKPAHLGYSIGIKREANINIYAGIVTGTIGRKRIGIPAPPDSIINMSAGIVHLRAGKKRIGLGAPCQMISNLFAGNLITRTGRITIGGIK